MIRTIKFKRATSTQWASDNPVLSAGELGFEYNTGMFKIGDSVTPWNDLLYFMPVEGFIPDLPDDPGGGGGIDDLEWVADRIFYSVTDDTFALTPITDDGRDLLAADSSASQQGVIDTYSRAEINALFSGAVPGSLMGYSELSSPWTCNNFGGLYPGSGFCIPISVTVTGENKDVWVEFVGGISHTSTTTVRLWQRANGAYTSPLGGQVSAHAVFNDYPLACHTKRKVFLTSGVSYTFDIGVEARASGTTTVFGDGTLGKSHLSVYRA